MSSDTRHSAVRGLYAITDIDASTTDKELLSRSEAVLRGGARLLQYRDKFAAAGQRADRATRLRQLCRRHGALFIVNDAPELACAVVADGLHIGATDGDPALVRARIPADMLLGVSCYNDLTRARAAAAAGADYLAFGAFYPSPNKPAARRADPALLAAATVFGLPLVAIGGITSDNAAPLLAAGADAVAVISGLFDAPDLAAMEASARRFGALFDARENSA